MMEASSTPSKTHSSPPSASLVGGVEQRFTWVGYLRQWQAILQFYGLGMSFTIRHALASVGRRAPGADLIRKNREELAATCRRYFFRLQEWGIMTLDDRALRQFAPAKGVLFAANHPGLFDAFILLAGIPDLNCVMRASLLRDPCLRGGALGCGFIPNDRGVEFVRQAVERLEAGENLLIFPEGTRTMPPALLNPFKGGLALVAKKSGRPVQTLFLEVDQPVLGKRQPLGVRPRYPVNFQVRVGDVLRPASGEKPAAFSQRLHEYFAAGLSSAGNRAHAA
jgi:1-acyl-sn-glycerol-3-phosphate acyltransferase